jgi:hypothetical protein
VKRREEKRERERERERERREKRKQGSRLRQGPKQSQQPHLHALALLLEQPARVVCLHGQAVAGGLWILRKGVRVVWKSREGVLQEEQRSCRFKLWATQRNAEVWRGVGAGRT